MYCFRMVEHNFILKTQCFDTIFLLQFYIPLPIPIGHFHMIVVITIQFYSKFQERTIEIQNMVPDTELSPKLEASYLFAFQHFPQSAFGCSAMRTQLSSEGFYFWPIHHLLGVSRDSPSWIRGGARQGGGVDCTAGTDRD